MAGNEPRRYPQVRLFAVLAMLGLASESFHVHIPHTEILLDGRWAFGFMGFALLGRWWAALLLAAVLSLPLGSNVPFGVGFGGNLLYAIPSLLVLRPVSRRMLAHWGPGWPYALGWLLLVLACYQFFNMPVLWGVTALMNGQPVWPTVVEALRTQPLLVESVLVALFSAAAMLAILSHRQVRSDQRRLEHINRMLLGIRRVNQLIVSEDSPSRLVQQACENLTETLGYSNAWVALLDPDSRTVAATASSGFGAGFDALRGKLAEGKFPTCMREALERHDTVVVGDPQAACPDCPISWEYGGRVGLTRALVFESREFGVLAVSVPSDFVYDAETKALFEELTDDLAFALHKVQMANDLANKSQEVERYFDLSLDLLCIATTDGYFLHLNPQWEETLGYPVAELENQSFMTLVHPDDRESTLEAVATLARHKEVLNFENRYLHKDGTYRWIEWRSIPYGKMIYAAARDITSRKKAEAALRESESFLRAVLEYTAEGFFVLNQQGRLVEVNDAYCAMSGYTRDEAIGMAITDLDMDETPSETAARVERIIAKGSEFFETHHRRKDGSPLTVEISATWLASGGGRFVCFCRDLTERRQWQERLAVLGRMLDDAPAAITIHDKDGRFLFANRITAALHGYDNLAEFLQINLHSLDVPESEAKLTERFRQIDENGEARFEVAHYRKDGSSFPLEVLAKSIEWEGRPAILSVATDITDRQRADEALRQSEERYRLLAFNTVDCIWRLSLDGVFEYVNPASLALLGYTPEEMIGTPLFSYCDERNVEIMAREMEAALANPEEVVRTDFTAEMVRKDGSSVPVEITGRLVCDEEGVPNALQGLTRDISERKRAEAALRENEERFERMLATVPDMISIHDPDMNILYSNWQGFAAVPPEKRLRRTKCYRTYRGLDAVCPDCRAKQVLATGKPAAELVELPDGTWVDLRVIPLLDENGQVEMFMEWVRDVTDQKNAEQERERLNEQLLQAQKMESVGRLAGGVAHDFNNMLGVILGHADLALENLAEGSPVRADLTEIRGAAARSADLTRHLLAFARKQTVAPKPLDLNETVQSMLKMLRRLIGEDIDLLWKPASELPPVYIDPAQIDQLLANLVVNARDAIGHTSGEVQIETASVKFDEAYCAAHAGFAPGEFVALAVTDNGRGMDEETKANIFEPFFTTKEVGKGTGLGLSTVYGIVKQNQGFINVYTELGEGTTFHVYLPALSRGTNDAPPREHPGKRSEGGNETLLIVEDEPVILNMTATMLRRLGYDVLTARTPGEAVRVVKEHAGDIHLLMTDVVMPEMNGRELAKTVLSLRPGIKRLFMSGYTADVIAHRGVLTEGVNFIQKPFSRELLAQKVRESLEE